MRGEVWSGSRRAARFAAAAALKPNSPQPTKTQQGKIWCAERPLVAAQEPAPLQEQQEVLWKQFFADTGQWWDNRQNKLTPRHPDFRHKESKVPLWLNNPLKPVWVDSQLANMDAGMKATLETQSIAAPERGSVAAVEGQLDVRFWRELCENGQLSVAVDELQSLVQRGCRVPSNLFYRLLKRCIQIKDLTSGRLIHALTVKSGYGGDAFLATHLIGLYASHGRLEEASGVFTRVPVPDACNWATIIFAYARHGQPAEAIRLYRKMFESSSVQPDDRLYSAVLKACAAAKDVISGREVHARITASSKQVDRFVQTGLVNMYVKCGSLEDARRLFDTLSDKDVVTWNAMIAGYAQQEMGQEAVDLYRSMQKERVTRPCPLTYAFLLQACGSTGERALSDGKQLHSEIKARGLEKDVVLAGSLVSMYVKCGSLEDAQILFGRLLNKDVVTWTTMIAGYAQKGMGQEALSLYRSMQQAGLSPDSVTYVCLLQACASIGVGALHEGKQLHAQIGERGLEEDAVVGGSLVNMYAKCGSLEGARRLFDKLPEKNVVAWTGMIAGYVQQGMGQEALSLYSSMQQEGLTPDPVTYVCLLQACASIGVGALDVGTLLHAQIEERGLEVDAVVGGSLANMYAKCGNLVDARRLFDKLLVRNVVAWNAMIAGYAQQGMGEEALRLYSSMQQEGVTPDSVTYVCLLQACAAVAALPLGERLHAEIEKKGMQADSNVGAALVNMYAKCGSVSDSQRVFDSLSERSIEAWNALVNGYARLGDSQVVFDSLVRMKLQGVHPNDVTFLSVLTVCSHAGLVDKGREYFEVMKTVYGISASMKHYICMVDLLGRAGHLHEALQMTKNMPLPPNDVMWLTLLGACRKWKNVEIGQHAFQGAISIDEKNAAAYVLMSNIYASTLMWEAAKEKRARRMNLGACKKPGQSWWTDMGGVVHTFLVGDKQHPESEGIYNRLAQLLPKMKMEGYVPHLESSLSDVADEMKEAGLCGHSERLAIAYALNKTAEGTTIRIVKNLRVCEDCHAATAYISKVEQRTIICRDASRFHVYKDGKCSCGDYW